MRIPRLVHSWRKCGGSREEHSILVHKGSDLFWPRGDLFKSGPQ